MQTVLLLQDWTDDSGVVHHAGETVTVDSATAEALCAKGIATTDLNGTGVGPTTTGVGPT